jgi:uncharacterized protein (DUF58 family)
MKSSPVSLPHSTFKWEWIEFAEVREYQIGDDFRSADRNVAARFGEPHIKFFSEEKELTVTPSYRRLISAVFLAVWAG